MADLGQDMVDTTESRSDVFDFLEHAQSIRDTSGHTENAKKARTVAASDWSQADYAHWNLYRALRQVTISRLVAGEPRAQITSRRNEDSELLKPVIATFEDELSVEYTREMLAALLRDVQGEASDAGNSYWYIDPWTGDIQHFSYFDGWFDNVMARPSAPEEGRYIFLRCLMDKNEFGATFGEQLQALGINPLEIKAGGGELEGREIVGASPGRRLQIDEDTTGEYVQPFTVLQSNQETPSAEDEGLVVYYKAWIRDGESESGWKYLLLYDRKVLDEIDWPAWVGDPTVYCFASDSLSNQFYQPSDYNHTRGYQETVDAILARVKDNSEILGDPPFYWNKATDALNQGKARLNSGEKIVVDQGDKPDFMQPPTLPNQYMEFVNMLVEFARSLELPDVLQGQTDQTDVQSGVAIERLRQEADQRLQMRMNNQDENLRKVGKVLCKIIYMRKMEEGRIVAAQQITGAREEQAALDMAIAAQYGEPIAPEVEPVEPDMVPDEQAMQFMPEPFNQVSLGMLDNDLVFSFEIEPTLSREDKIAALTASFQAASMVPNVMLDGTMFLKMAGAMSGQSRLAEELIATYEMFRPVIEQAMMAQAAQQAEQAPNNKEGGNAGE